MTNRTVLRTAFVLTIISCCGFVSAQPATTAAAQLKITQGRQSLLLPYPAGLSETSDSNIDLRVLADGSGKIKVSVNLLPADQEIDPVSAAAAIETSKGALQAAWGANLIEPPTARPNPSFPMAMHYRYRVSSTQVVDQTRYWKMIGEAKVQCDVQVNSEDEPTLKSANAAVQQWLVSSGRQPITAAETGPKQYVLGESGVKFSRPDHFEEIGAQQQNTVYEFVAEDRSASLIVTLLADAKSLSPDEYLAKSKADLAAKRLLAGPELIEDSKANAAIHWSFSSNGTPRQGVRIIKQSGSHVVACEVTTSGETSAALTVADAIAQSLTRGFEPTTVPAGPSVARTPLAKNQPPLTGEYGAKLNQRAQTALEQAKKFQADGKDDEAYARFKFIVSEYSRTSAAAEADDAIGKYESNADFMQKHQPKQASDEDKASAMLAMADNYASAGATVAAKKKYQEVIDQHAGTKAAETAKKRMATLK